MNTTIKPIARKMLAYLAAADPTRHGACALENEKEDGARKCRAAVALAEDTTVDPIVVSLQLPLTFLGKLAAPPMEPSNKLAEFMTRIDTGAPLDGLVQVDPVVEEAAVDRTSFWQDLQGRVADRVAYFNDLSSQAVVEEVAAPITPAPTTRPSRPAAPFAFFKAAPLDDTTRSLKLAAFIEQLPADPASTYVPFDELCRSQCYGNLAAWVKAFPADKARLPFH